MFYYYVGSLVCAILTGEEGHPSCALQKSSTLSAGRGGFSTHAGRWERPNSEVLYH